MLTPKKQKKKSIKRRWLIIATAIVAIIAVGGGAYMLVARNDESRTPKDRPTVKNDRGQNIDMSPATPDDNKAINDKKESGNMDEVPSISGDIQVTIVRANQNASGVLQVRSQLSGVNTGTCTLTLTKDAATIVKQASVVLQNSTYICDGIDVAPSEFQGKAGTWLAKLTVTRPDNKSNAAQQEVDIKL